MHRRIAALTTTLFCSFLLSSCSPGSSRSTTPLRVSEGAVATDRISLLFETAKCQDLSRGGFILVDDRFGLEELFLPRGEQFARSYSAKVDFTREQVLVVDFGQLPNVGYTMGLVTEAIEVKGQTGIVRIALPDRAKPDKKQIQQVSHICAFYVLPNLYETLEIRSQFDDLLTQF